MRPAVTMAALAAAFAMVAAAVAIRSALPGPPVPALVEVRVTHGLTEDRATGVVVAPGRVLTVAHVLGDPPTPAPPSTGWSAWREGDEIARGRVLAVDRRADLALLAAPGADGPGMPLAPGRHASGTVTVALRGGARETDATARNATFTDVLGATSRRPVLRLGTAVTAGDSGSPVLDADGRLAGIVFAADERPRVSWAVGAPAIRALLRRG